MYVEGFSLNASRLPISTVGRKSRMWREFRQLLDAVVERRALVYFGCAPVRVQQQSRKQLLRLRDIPFPKYH